jgi:hypothetical protein
MLKIQSRVRPDGRISVQDLRKQIGLFSFQSTDSKTRPNAPDSLFPDLAIRPGAVIEWIVAAPGHGAISAALQILRRTAQAHQCWAIIDPAAEFHLPAFTGWGIDPGSLLLIRPTTPDETTWAIEQCLRSTGLSFTLALVENRFPARVHRRWQLAAEVGGGVGLVFRPLWAAREPIWADLRLRVIPRSAHADSSRTLDIEVLYRRGGLRCADQAWEIDHAAGDVRLVS